MKQIFQSLLENALEFNDKPNPQIQLLFSEDEQFYQFRITDNGIGIRTKDLDKVFKIFDKYCDYNKIKISGKEFVKNLEQKKISKELVTAAINKKMNKQLSKTFLVEIILLFSFIFSPFNY